MDPYRVLGVDAGATPDEIRRAYRARARALHPDGLTGASDAERADAGARMAEVNAAFAMLSADRAMAENMTDAPPPPLPHARPRGCSPWVLVIVLLLAIFVFTAYAGGRASPKVSSRPPVTAR